MASLDDVSVLLEDTSARCPGDTDNDNGGLLQNLSMLFGFCRYKDWRLSSLVEHPSEDVAVVEDRGRIVAKSLVQNGSASGEDWVWMAASLDGGFCVSACIAALVSESCSSSCNSSRMAWFSRCSWAMTSCAMLARSSMFAACHITSVISEILSDFCRTSCNAHAHCDKFLSSQPC